GDLDAARQTEGGADGAGTKRAIKPSRDALLAEADAIAKEPRPVASAAPASATRGAVGGPTWHADITGARATDSYRVMFRKMEPAIVQVSCDGDTDLDCWVYDESGNIIDSDTGPSDDCSLRWTPAWTGPFRIKIKNFGREANLYTVITN